MAEINFGLLDTQLPGRIATIPLQAQEAGQANALRAMQMMQGMSQNRLSDLNYNEQMRGIEEQKQIRSALSGIDVTTLPGQNEAVSRATRINPDTGFKLQKMFRDAEKSNADLLKTRAETDKIGFERATKNLEQFAGQLRQVASDPTDDNVRAVFSRGVSLGIPMQEITADQARILALPLDQRARRLAFYGSTAADIIKTLQTTTRTTPLGNISRDQTVDFFGRPVGEPVDTPIGISANTTATINAARANHLENLAQQGWTFDSDRGIAVNARKGISRPISTLMSPVGGGGVPAAPAGVAAPAVPGVAGGGVPGQRQAPAGQPAVAGVLGPKPADVQKTEIELNKQYASESKGFTETKLAIDKAKAALKDAATNPTAGLSAGTAFMKILDPQSVVRETELAMALKSSGWFDRATNIANTLQSGKTILTPTQITNLNKTIDGLFEEVKTEQRIVYSGYARRARSYGLDVGNIIIDRGQNKIGTTEKTPPNAPPIQSFRRP